MIKKIFLPLVFISLFFFFNQSFAASQDLSPTSKLAATKSLQQRINELYADLHNLGSGERAKGNFPDLKRIYTDQGTKNIPKNIKPFRYYYSKEAKLTIGICNINYTIFICQQKINHLLTKKDVKNCQITPVLLQIDPRLTIPKVRKLKTTDLDLQQITLKWKKVIKAKYYQIKILQKTADNKYQQIKKLRTKKNKKIKIITDLQSDTTYYFQVRACKKKNKCGAWSKKVSGKTLTEDISDPILELPLASISEVSGIQVFHDPGSSQLHTGFDFKLDNNREIIAPISGEISSVHKLQMSNNYWIIDVMIDINSKWQTFIAFEPYTTEESVIDQQMNYINVSVNDQVIQGQSLGTLTPVIGSEFPHIHWQVQIGTDEPVNPYDYCSENAKAQLDTLCQTFNKQCT